MASEGAECSLVSRNREQLLLLIGLVALSFNLRPAASSVGPVVGALNDDLGMSPTTAGVLTTLPVLCFALFGALAPWCARVIGAHRVMLIALGLSTLGLWGRSVADNSVVFILATIPPLAGMATANVLLPSLIKRHFPTRIGLLTAIYTTMLAIGMTMASALTVPIGEASGSWRYGIAIWGLTAFVAALPWIGLIGHDVHPDAGQRRSVGFSDVSHTRLGWMMAGYFGFQSLHAYAIFGWMPEIFGDAGYSASNAGLLLALTTSVSIPVSFVLPRAGGAPGQPDADRGQPRHLLRDRLHRPAAVAKRGSYRMVLADRSGHWRIPTRTHPDRAAFGDARRHRRSVELHSKRGLPDRGNRAVHDGSFVRRQWFVDTPASHADRLRDSSALDRPPSRKTTTRRGPTPPQGRGPDLRDAHAGGVRTIKVVAGPKPARS